MDLPHPPSTPPSDSSRSAYKRPWLRGLTLLAIVLTALGGSHRLATQTHRLVAGDEDMAAVDLIQRFDELRVWSSGTPLYQTESSAAYPPAGYLMLWPLLGWSSLGVARWLWAAVSLGSLLLLARGFSRLVPAAPLPVRVLVTLVPLACYATAITIGNGQIGILVMLALMFSLVGVSHVDRSRIRDVAIAASFVLALTKPSLSAPFFWIVAFRRGGWRPATWIVGGWLAVSLAASSFQPGSVVSQHLEWSGRATVASRVSTRVDLPRPPDAAPRGPPVVVNQQGSYGTLHHLTDVADLKRWNGLLSIGLLMTLGVWVWRHRRTDVWILAGVTAVVARVWTYHRIYDDILIILPMLALARLAWHREGSDLLRTSAGFLFGLGIVANLIPASFVAQGPPRSWLFVTVQVGFWLVTASFLMLAARNRSTRRHENP